MIFTYLLVSWGLLCICNIHWQSNMGMPLSTKQQGLFCSHYGTLTDYISKLCSGLKPESINQVQTWQSLWRWGKWRTSFATFGYAALHLSDLSIPDTGKCPIPDRKSVKNELNGCQWDVFQPWLNHPKHESKRLPWYQKKHSTFWGSSVPWSSSSPSMELNKRPEM